MRPQPSRAARTLVACALLLLGAAATAAAQTPSAPAQAPAAQPLTAQERARYVGDYEVNGPEGKMIFHVFERDGALVGQPGEDPNEMTRLVYHGNHTFRPEAEPRATMTFTVADGKAMSFVILLPDGERHEGTRKP